MGDTERPTLERDGDQEQQAQHLTRTGNGPTVDDEVALLAEEYGPADMAGVYSGTDAGSGDQHDEPAGEPAGEQPVPAVEDTATGGDSA